jgi:hypothetical protein
LLFVAGCLSNQFALSGKRYGVFGELATPSQMLQDSADGNRFWCIVSRNNPNERDEENGPQERNPSLCENGLKPMLVLDLAQTAVESGGAHAVEKHFCEELRRKDDC